MRVPLLGTFKQGSSHLGFRSVGGTRKLWQLIWPVPAEDPGDLVGASPHRGRQPPISDHCAGTSRADSLAPT